MKAHVYDVIGVMSGTSLDGIDLAWCRFEKTDRWHFTILHAETSPYSQKWKTSLGNAIYLNQDVLKDLNEDYTRYLGETIRDFIEKIKPFPQFKSINAVCSHGHTVLHQPQKGITLQIGNLPEIASLVKNRVVCDFRVQDVLYGGQGAPLVPIGDELLFSDYDYCLNLGGFANISTKKDGQRIAYDICPLNIVLNPLAEKLGFAFDDKGNLASSGKLIPELLDRLNALVFYRQQPPKSLGLEWVLQNVFPIINNYSSSVYDVLHTVTEHIAMQLANNMSENAKILITGGGAYNEYLLRRVGFYKTLDVCIPDSRIVEYKEALIFGLLGVLKLEGENNCLASVTGAKNDHSSGVIFEYKNP